MTKREYLQKISEAFEDEKLTEEIYNCMKENADLLFDDEDDHDERLPSWYAEVEYDDFDSAEAINGARFDDMNYLRYTER